MKPELIIVTQTTTDTRAGMKPCQVIAGFEVRNERGVYLTDTETLVKAIEAAKEMAVAQKLDIEYIKLAIEPEVI